MRDFAKGDPPMTSASTERAARVFTDLFYTGTTEWGPSSLPGGMCQSPHWGYVVKGRVRVKYPDHEETYSTGQAYYLPPGHIPVIEEDSEFVEFSPLGDYQEPLKTLEG